MKRVIWGCTLMLVGIIGASSLVIAHALLVGPGAWSNILNMVPGIGGRGCGDGFIVLLFWVITIIGGIVSACELRSASK